MPLGMTSAEAFLAWALADGQAELPSHWDGDASANRQLPEPLAR